MGEKLSVGCQGTELAHARISKEMAQLTANVATLSTQQQEHVSRVARDMFDLRAELCSVFVEGGIPSKTNERADCRTAGQRMLFSSPIGLGHASQASPQTSPHVA